MFSHTDFIQGVSSGLVKLDPDTSQRFQPSLVLNDYANGRKTLEFVLDNIRTCQTFRIAVAFVTRSGVACLHETLKEFGLRGGKGDILVSTYLNFSDPIAIKALTHFRGISVSFVNQPNFHGKTYLFEHNEYAQLMIGSSNLTQNALGKNTEVNLGVSLKRTSGLYQQTISQLKYWDGTAQPISEANLLAYAEAWRSAKKKIESLPPSLVPEELFVDVKPRQN